MSEYEVDDLISRVYDVTMGDCHWADFLAELRQFCGARNAALVQIAADRPHHVIGEAAGSPSTGNIQPGTLLPLTESGELQLLLDFSNADAEQRAPDLLSPLLPHIRRVVQIEQNLDTAGQAGEAAAAAFADRLSAAVLLYDRQIGEVVHSNAAARRLMGENDSARIQQAMRRLIPARESEPLPSFTRFSWSAGRPPAEPEMVGVVLSLNRHTRRVATSESDRMALIFLHNPSQPPELQSQHLKSRYGLTPKEARLALGVAYGGTLASLAEEFSLSTQTLKSQMKSVLKKVGVQSQAQMTAQLLSDDMLLFAGQQNA